MYKQIKSQLKKKEINKIESEKEHFKLRTNFSYQL